MKKIIGIIAAAAVAATLLTGCQNADSDGPLVGKWSYIHEPEEMVLTIKPNGTAVYKDKKYDCVVSDGYISLNGKTESFNLRYVENGNGIDLYEQSTYKRTSEGDGIIGIWKCDNNETFEFTEEGTFIEDGIFPGHYFVSDDGSTIRLAYNDPIADTILYYSLDGDDLFIEYPWPMVPTTK